MRPSISKQTGLAKVQTDCQCWRAGRQWAPIRSAALAAFIADRLGAAS